MKNISLDDLELEMYLEEVEKILELEMYLKEGEKYGKLEKN